MGLGALAATAARGVSDRLSNESPDRPNENTSLTTMARIQLLEIDESCILACDIDDAMRHLDSADAIRAWFSARRFKSTVIVATPTTTVTIDNVRERWLSAQNALVIDGQLGHLRLHGHLTVRAIVRSINDGHVEPGTEIWVHVELEQSNEADRSTSALRDIIGRGLTHIRHELDTTCKPNYD